MKKYNVIWFDDEFSSLNSIMEKAKLNGINLFGYSNAKDGIEELKKNISKYDAAIVDGKFYTNSTQTGSNVDDGALLEVARIFDQLSTQKLIPWFILSGQISFTKEKNRFADAYKNNKVYDKLNLEGLENLWIDLKIEADKQPETQIRHKYQNVFDICKTEYIGNDAAKYLIDILTNIEFPKEKFDDELYFNGLRKLMELIFRASNKFGLLHDKCIQNDDVNLTWSSLFMSGKEVELKPSHDMIVCKKAHFPSILSQNVKNLISISNIVSHTEGEEKEKGKLNFTEYKRYIKSNYLIYALTFQVMDVLIWFKNYIDNNSDIEKNKLLWSNNEESLSVENDEWITGTVTRIAENGWGTFKPDSAIATISIIPKMVTDNNLNEKDSIKVKVEPSPDGTKTFIKEIMKG